MKIISCGYLIINRYYSRCCNYDVDWLS